MGSFQNILKIAILFERDLTVYSFMSNKNNKYKKEVANIM